MRIYFFFMFILPINYLFTQNKIDVLNLGAKGDGISDDTKIIQRALNMVTLQGGGTVIIPTAKSDYIISETLYIGSNTRLEFEKSFIKLNHYTSIGTVLINHPGSTNITIVNPRIDGNNIFAGGTGENGISFNNGGSCLISGGVIKNCRSGNIAFKLGGKALQVEDKSVESFIADGTKIYNSTFALSSQFSIKENKINNFGIKVLFKNIYAENCDSFVIIQQVDGLEESSNKHNVSIENFVSNNCGFGEGVFLFSRARGFHIKNGIVKGNIKVESIFRGRHSEGELSNIEINQPAENIIDLKPSFHAIATTKSEFNRYFLKLNSSYNYLLYTTPDYKHSYRELFNSIITVNSFNQYNKKIILPQSIFKNTQLVYNRLSKTDSSIVESKKGGLLFLFNE